jgi:hypothetical protein
MGDCFVFTHMHGFQKLLETYRDKLCNLRFCWTINHRFSHFLFFISTFYTTKV